LLSYGGACSITTTEFRVRSEGIRRGICKIALGAACRLRPDGCDQARSAGKMTNKSCFRVFLSHGSGDTYIVEKTLRPLVETSGASVFVDSGALVYGDDFRQTIIAELEQCHEILVLITPTSITRPWIFAELGASLIRKVRVVIVNYGVLESTLHEKGILSILGTKLFLDINKFDSYIEQLTQRVNAKDND
jgi:hypothetical protein